MDFQAAKPSSPTPSSSSYYIRPPDGGEPERYQRVSGFIKLFADTANLEKRSIRYAVLGSAKYADQLMGMDVDADRYEIDQIANKASREAGVWQAADIGTALHALTEDYDNGHLKLGFTKIPDSPAVQALERGAMKELSDNLPAMSRDLDGYAALVEAYEVETMHAEVTLVHDRFKAAGTADRFVKIGNPMGMPVDEEAACMTADLKTGSIDFGRREKSYQLAMYASMSIYNHDTGERSESGASQKYGYIIHLPHGEGRASLIPVKLERPLEELEKVFEAHQMKSRKNMWTKYALDQWLPEQIQATTTEEELEQLYRRTKAYWGRDEVILAKTHVTQIKEG